MSILCSMVGATFTVAAVAQVLRSKKGITAVGNAQVSTAQSQFGGASAFFDGTGDALLIEHQGSMRFGTDDFSIEFWYRPASRAQNYPIIFSNKAGFDAGNIVFHDRHVANTTKLTVWIYNFNSGAPIFTTTTSTVNGTWYHIALTRSGTSLKLFVNGTQEGSTYTTSADIDTGAGSALYYLSSPTSETEFNGFIDEVRVSNSARYTANFTPSTTAFVNDANTLLLIHANGTNGSTFFEDDNGVRAHRGIIANGNAKISTTQSQFGGSSAQFDGTGDGLTITDLTPFAFGTNDFTMECWIRFTPIPSGFVNIIDFRDFAGSGANSPVIYMNSATVAYATGTTARITTSTNLSSNTWYHFAVSRSGSSTRLFVNGTQVGSTFTDTTNYTCNAFTIANAKELGTGINGFIDEIRISNSARYTSNFTAPTTPFVNDANTLLLLHMDGTNGSTVFRDDNGALGFNWTGRSAKTIQAIGNAQISTAQGKFGGASMLSDGTGDALRIVQNSDFNFGTGDWCIEFYIRPTTNLSGTYNIFDMRLDGETNAARVSVYSFSNSIRFYHSNADRITYNVTLAAGTWYHFAISRSGTQTKMWIDGTQVGSTYTDSTNYLESQVTIGAYSAGGSSYTGSTPAYFDEIRISKGAARYTANFTPSTTAFVNDANTVLLIHADGVNASTTFTDDIGTGRTQKGISAIGNAQIDTAQSQFGGSSALFDGTGDYLIVGNTVDSDLALAGTTWTVEFWARINSHSGEYNNVIGIWSDAGSGDGSVFYISTNMYQASNKLGIQYIYGNDSNSGAIQFGSALSTGIWRHHAFVRNGNTLTVYTNGTSVGTHDMTGITFDLGGLNTSGVTSLKMTIGAMTGGGGGYNGWLDEIRISNTARYTANFTAPTAAFQNDANTVLLIHADGTDTSTVFTDDNGIAPYTP